ncbi:MAG: Metallophosphoesterase [Pedosphaera sp.]|nr:Metallophosphoesterase [Pedosphaera sp.]
MPIHLPPISRRRFLAGSLAASASLLLNRNLLAKERKPDPNTWALVSDIHLAADRNKLGRGINMADNFAQVTREIIDPARRPSAMLVSGDLAFNTGEKGDYLTVTELLEPIRKSGLPIYLTLGNHDEREHFWDALTELNAAKHGLADHQASVIHAPRANWFVLDSLEKTMSTPGLLGEAQLKWLAHALDENKDKPAIVVAHHNLVAGGDKPAGLKDADQLLEIIRPRKQVKAYFYGHTHNWGIDQDPSGIHLINLPPTAYLFKEGKPNGWVHATLERKGVRLELRCLDAKHPVHGEVHHLKWRA